jgi:hypothetical protein
MNPLIPTTTDGKIVLSKGISISHSRAESEAGNRIPAKNNAIREFFISMFIDILG